MRKWLNTYRYRPLLAVSAFLVLFMLFVLPNEDLALKLCLVALLGLSFDAGPGAHLQGLPYGARENVVYGLYFGLWFGICMFVVSYRDAGLWVSLVQGAFSATFFGAIMMLISRKPSDLPDVWSATLRSSPWIWLMPFLVVGAAVIAAAMTGDRRIVSLVLVLGMVAIPPVRDWTGPAEPVVRVLALIATAVAAIGAVYLTFA